MFTAVDVRPVDARGRVTPDPIFSDSDDNATFWKDGYVIKDLLDPETFSRLQAGFSELRPDDGFKPGAEARYHCTFLDNNRDYRRAVNRLTHEVIDPLLGDVLPGYEMLTSNFYVKQPGGGLFEIHLNWPTLVNPLDTTVTIWIPLTPALVRTGTMHVVPGSHKLYPDVASLAAARFFEDFQNELIENHLIPLEIDPGQAVVLDDTLIHWTSENHSDDLRVTLQIELVPTGSTTAIWVPDPQDERWFMLYPVDEAFFLTQDKEAFRNGRDDVPCIARVPNPNRAVTYEEFCTRIEQSDAVRRRSYVLPDSH